MNRFVPIVFLLGLCMPVSAQFNGCPAGFCSPKIASASYTGPGDVVSGANGWWGFRAYNATYASALGNIADIVDAATGAATCTMKANSTGDADLASLSCAGGTVSVTTFCTVTHVTGCKITKLYDQTGGGNPLTQATLANMPILTLNAIGSKPCATIDGSIFSIRSTSGSGLTSTGTFSTVADRTTFNSNFGGIIQANLGGPGYSSSANTGVLFQGSVATFPMPDNVFHALQSIFNGASSIAYMDGTNNTGLNPGSTSFASNYTLGEINGGFNFPGLICEAGAWVALFTGTNNSNMNTNQHSYWGF